ncbi:PREDICTED: sucrose nonfermenting 4-like protein isoform X1 [Lupinus angustifolius]|uniref:sucrose nonfermenting 4-like protein isoform X1 n=1 Tax=Lupinus angustifolius TaxID=3871 RepID=UPI00092F76CE|nr:PREDICTED: sucrose nonfermenting 4-like protein isoform X1 [Lupinus angustifolius]XP_019419610.1 PREDICTED: sucrose nonfermenting 4-like protein isoform X1 [Lupinus angustifolius]XP_019419611.1 PREDICTED: sucrose nonfermenting 4-like protein isoform X1 [Lupinus angustifolius]XP_019419612.1 PREDICTED: sucrose nonfermenting 4-like protein isoform X1 [Lupinus angustifolius]
MFSQSMDSARDVGGASGIVLIPMRFVWPYGGRSVFLSGSFTRWSELLPMSPVEGCPTVFQVVYSVPPGCHQYKFFVDREWRHDENQPYISGEYGIVNTVFLATDPNCIPVVTPEIASGNNMDVDNEAFRRTQVRLTDGTLSELLPRISDGDVQISRQRISEFLCMHTAYELLPESGKVVALDIELPVKQAFHVLHEQGIYVAPLWDFCKGQFVGVLSASDFILILRELGNHGSNMTEEELETHTISAWKEGKSYLNSQNNGRGTVFSRGFIHAGPYDNLNAIAMKILQKGVSIVPIVHSSSEDGSFPQLLHLTSLTGILKCICRYFRHCPSSLPILQLPICALPVGTWVPKIGEPNRRPLAMLRPSASLASALNLLVQARVSSIPIVDDNDSLLDIYCRSDITALAKDRAYTHINLDEMTVQQALQLGQDANSPYEFRSQRCQMCLRSDSLHKVMERLANPGVRRIVIVEAGSNRVEGIVSLGDIFKFFLG